MLKSPSTLKDVSRNHSAMHGDKSASQKTVRDKRNEKASVDMEPLLPTTNDSPTKKKKKIGDVPMGNTVPHSIPLGVHTNARAYRALLWSEKARRVLSIEKILGTSEGVVAFAK